MVRIPLSCARSSLVAVLLASLVALMGAASARGGGETYLTWKVEAVAGKPLVTWKISGETKWYVAEVQVAARPGVDAAGSFKLEHLVAYDVLTAGQSDGRWQGEAALGPGTYHVRLRLRYPGPCSSGCESATSTRTLRVEPPKIGRLTWSARTLAGRTRVSWRHPRGKWFVALVLVDDDRDFSSPSDVGIWREAAGRAWRSRKLAPGIYFVRLHARFAGCETCLWTSKPRRVVVRNR